MSEDNTHGTPEYKTERCRQFIIDEVCRKKNFLAWQENWNKNNAILLQLREAETKAATDKEDEPQRRKNDAHAPEKPTEKVERKGPQPGNYPHLQ